MEKNEEVIEFIMSIQLQQDNDEEKDQVTRQLIKELDEFTLESIKPLENEAPQGTKAGFSVEWGTLLIAVGPIIATKLLDFLHAWALRQEGRTISIKYQVSSEKSLEIEFPTSLSQNDVRKYVRTIVDSATRKSTKK